MVKQDQETVTFTFSLSHGALILSDAPGWDAPVTFARVLFDPSGFYYLLGAPAKGFEEFKLIALWEADTQPPDPASGVQVKSGATYKFTSVTIALTTSPSRRQPLEA